MPPYSTLKRGQTPPIPGVPEVPSGAQYRGGFSPKLHLQFPDGTYLAGSLPPIPTADHATVGAAIEACPQEVSYSGTGRSDYRLTVEGPGDGTASLKAGAVTVGTIMIDPVLGSLEVAGTPEVVSPLTVEGKTAHGTDDDDDPEGDEDDVN